MKVNRAEKGFTLVEIAIVMVIIGLLLGGALKGQEMIENSRVKRVKADFDQYVAAYYSYQDAYRALPGDNDRATAQHGGAAGDSNGDGTIDSVWNATNAARESRLFWQNLRSAGLIVGATDDTTLPANSFGGTVGVQDAVADFTGVGLCFSNIQPDIAVRLEAAYDDNTANTGIIQGIDSDEDVVTAYTAAASYDNVLCFEI